MGKAKKYAQPAPPYQVPHSWTICLFLAFFGWLISNNANLVQMKAEITPMSMSFSKLLVNSTITTSEAGDYYIHRPELEKSVNEAFTLTPNGMYFVVYGNKGVGKSELITHAAIGKKGVVRIQISSIHEKEDLVQVILRNLKYQGSQFDIPALVGEMRNMEMEFGIYPTIIFDVERGGTVEDTQVTLRNVRGVAKQLAVASRCIIVLAEANAILEFGGERRERFIFVDEFEEEEAIKLLRGKGCNISDEELKEIFEKIGTHAISLQRSGKASRESAHAYVKEILGKARKDLVAFPLQTLLKGLKDHDPEGVDPEYFKKLEEEGVDLSDVSAVGKVMKEHALNNPILFREELQEYQLISKAHKAALKSYEPIHPLPIPS